MNFPCVRFLTWFPRPPEQSLSDQFNLIVDGFKRALATHVDYNRALSPLVWLLYNRLGLVMRRFAAMAARHAAGIAPRLRRPPTPPLKPRMARPIPEHLNVPYIARSTPRGYGWLLKALGPHSPNMGHAATLLGQFAADPQVAALLAADPQAARLLRPWFRMLRLPFPPAPPRPRRAKPALPEPIAPEPEAPEPEATEPGASKPRPARVLPEPPPPAPKPKRRARRRIPVRAATTKSHRHLKRVALKHVQLVPPQDRVGEAFPWPRATWVAAPAPCCQGAPRHGLATMRLACGCS